jgi:transcriptional regulator with XRE-family HTH domain
MSISKLKNIRDFISSSEHQERIPHIKRAILLSEKIYGRRKDLNLTQNELAERTGTTQRIISQIEEGIYAPEKGIGDQLYDKLSIALEIDRDYIISDKIDRKTFEIFAYLGEKLEWKWDIMQFMKLPYFIDLQSVKDLGFQMTNFEYRRYNFWPFDKKVYSYRELFEQNSYDVTYSYIGDFLSEIDSAIAKLPITDGEKLKMLSYKTSPMKALGATLGGNEHMNEILDLTI